MSKIAFKWDLNKNVLKSMYIFNSENRHAILNNGCKFSIFRENRAKWSRFTSVWLAGCVDGGSYSISAYCKHDWRWIKNGRVRARARMTVLASQYIFARAKKNSATLCIPDNRYRFYRISCASSYFMRRAYERAFSTIFFSECTADFFTDF